LIIARQFRPISGALNQINICPEVSGEPIYVLRNWFTSEFRGHLGIFNLTSYRVSKIAAELVLSAHGGNK